jgi:large subunit ribosomal protein L3
MVQAIIGRKIGMTQLFSEEDGSVTPVTAIEAGPCTVVQVKTLANDGYEALQLGFGHKKRHNKPAQGHLKGTGTFAVLREVRVDDAAQYEVGQTIDVSIFEEGSKVDVVGRSRGMGFAGGVKRYHFAGGPKTHGQSDRHRAPGSVGAGTTPGRVFKGLHMAGRMGDERKTTQNLRVMKVEPERNLIMVRGAVPGISTGLVMVRQAVKTRKKSQQ